MVCRFGYTATLLTAIAAITSAFPCFAPGICVAAYSTTRRLDPDYNGTIYRVQRASDGKSLAIGTVVPPDQIYNDHIADVQAQDSFCANTLCTVTALVDQSGNGNDLVVAAGSHAAVANQVPTVLNGQKVYGLSLPAGSGYRLSGNEAGKDIPINDEPQTVYAVVSGSVYNSGCCWDFGNAEIGSQKTGGPGSVEALNFGSRPGSSQNYKSGNGPWIQADFGDALYASINKSTPSPSMSDNFVLGILKGGQNRYTIRGGSAQGITNTTGGGSYSASPLVTYYDGPRPAIDKTMRKQGGVTLGVGGRGGNLGSGVFFEGAILPYYASDYPVYGEDDMINDSVAGARYGLPALP